jgi:hypothetical protein
MKQQSTKVEEKSLTCVLLYVRMHLSGLCSILYNVYEALQMISPPTFCFKASSRSKTPRLVFIIAISPGRNGLMNFARRPAARSFISLTVKVTFFDGLLTTLRLFNAGLLSLYLRVSQSLRVAMFADVVGVYVASGATWLPRATAETNPSLYRMLPMAKFILVSGTAMDCKRALKPF